MGIREAREAKGYSQHELAKLVHVKQPSVAQWEAGTKTPRVEKLLRLSVILDCSVDQLLDRNGA